MEEAPPRAPRGVLWEVVMDIRTIVVGVDGSPASDTAIDWGAAEAVRRGVPLEVLHTLAAHSLAAVPAGGAPPLIDDDEHEDVLDAAAARARASFPGISVITRSVGRSLLTKNQRWWVTPSSPFFPSLPTTSKRPALTALPSMSSLHTSVSYHCSGPVTTCWRQVPIRARGSTKVAQVCFHSANVGSATSV